ncbi:Obg family GTPase CgtA [Buchnera aphidicola]|uniref:Obg family GTPase CgtA n=1 Tax=Buchnera aphidicola TaxID=9 RepID=UPI0031B86F43
MKFIDQVTITVSAGNGGNGCTHFRREKFEPKGGPDGGNGGDGGNIWIQSNQNLNTLVDYRFNSLISSEDGEPGKSKNKSGKNGSDKIIYVPIGTRIINSETKEIIADLNKIGEKILVAKGGKKGIGNRKFRSSTNQAPYKHTNGRKGEKYTLTLQLLLIADVGIIGLPNAGKSTLMHAISNAKPKIGEYPFTTLIPTLGKVKIKKNFFIIADIPGLIKGASHGSGLGIQFLQHIKKCRILLHLIDISLNKEIVIKNIKNIILEIRKYSREIYNKPIWIIFNKIDYYKNQEEKIKKKIIYIKNKTKINRNYFFISAKKKKGTKNLCNKISEYLSFILK